VTCTVKQAKTSSRVISARLSRDGRLIARASGPGVVFRLTHRPSRGPYRLTTVTRHADGAVVTLTTTVVLA
jgi:hypothetical protein